MFRPLFTCIIGLIGWTSDPPPPPPPVMAYHERRIIQMFANGRVDLRDEAVRIYRAYCCREERQMPEMRFMAEVDTNCPDLGLRARYREEVIARLRAERQAA